MSWHQMSEEEQRQHEEEISEGDWADYERWLDRDRPWWMYLREEREWLKKIV